MTFLVLSKEVTFNNHNHIGIHIKSYSNEVYTMLKQPLKRAPHLTVIFGPLNTTVRH